MRPSAVDIMARTETLLADNAALRVQLAAAREWSGQVARQHPRFLSGASGPEPIGDAAALRRHVVGRLIEGSLPAPGRRIWAGAGSGRPCSVCGLLIGGTEIEYEVDVDEVALLAHIGCFDLWTEEAAALRGPWSGSEEFPRP
jgi:hypothetical protein